VRSSSVRGRALRCGPEGDGLEYRGGAALRNPACGGRGPRALDARLPGQRRDARAGADGTAPGAGPRRHPATGARNADPIGTVRLCEWTVVPLHDGKGREVGNAALVRERDPLSDRYALAWQGAGD